MSALVAATNFDPYLALMLGGFVVGTFGHIIRSTPLILFGILLIGAASVAVGAYALG